MSVTFSVHYCNVGHKVLCVLLRMLLSIPNLVGEASMLGKEGQRITVQLTEWGMGRLFPLPSRIGSLGSFMNWVCGRALAKDTFRHILKAHTYKI